MDLLTWTRILAAALAGGALLATGQGSVGPGQTGQGGGPQGASTQEDVLDEQIRKLREQKLDLAVELESIGALDPWPPADPELDVDDWRSAVGAAKPIAPSKFMESLESVDLVFARSTSLDALFDGQKDWIREILRVVHDQDLLSEPTSLTKLRVLVQLGGGEVSTAGESEGYGAYCWRVDAALQVPARVLRGEEVHFATVDLAQITSIRIHSRKPTRTDIVLELRRAIEAVIRKAKADSRAAPGANGFGAWLGDGTQTQVRHAAFRSSHGKLHSGSHHIRTFGAVEANPAMAGSFAELESLATPAGLQKHWENELLDLGFPVIAGQGPTLRHDWIMVRHPDEDALKNGYAFASRLSIYDHDCLVVSNGQWLRVPGYSFAHRRNVDVSLPYGVLREGQVHLQDLEEILSEALNTGGLDAEEVRHKNADAVLAYLKTRQMVEVPEEALKKISNRIAVLLRPGSDVPNQIHQTWLQERDGEPFFDLSAAGATFLSKECTAETRAAILNTMVTLGREDPLVLNAFHNPFGRRLRDGAIVLPPGYADRLKGKRPIGAGKISSERLITGRELITRLRKGGKEDDVATAILLQPLWEEIEDQKVLVVTYRNRKDTDESKRHPPPEQQHYFWFETEPESWFAYVYMVPAELGFRQVGPPLRLAPEDVDKAELEISEYQKRLNARRKDAVK